MSLPICCLVVNTMPSLPCLLLPPWCCYYLVITVLLSLHRTTDDFLSMWLFQDDMFRCWRGGKIEWKCIIYPAFQRTFSTLWWRCWTLLHHKRAVIWRNGMEEWGWYELVNMTADWVGLSDDQCEQYTVTTQYLMSSVLWHLWQPTNHAGATQDGRLSPSYGRDGWMCLRGKDGGWSVAISVERMVVNMCLGSWKELQQCQHACLHSYQQNHIQPHTWQWIGVLEAL